MTIRVSLTEDDFRALVRGEVVKQQGPRGLGAGVFVEITLQDIGWNRIITAVEDAINK